MFSINKMEKFLQRKNMEVPRRVFNLFYALYVTLFITASAMGEVENNYIESHPELGLETYQFHEMLYFMVVTMTTVGYGDISPETDYGRGLVVLTVVVILSVLPKRF